MRLKFYANKKKRNSETNAERAEGKKVISKHTNAQSIDESATKSTSSSRSQVHLKINQNVSSYVYASAEPDFILRLCTLHNEPSFIVAPSINNLSRLMKLGAAIANNFHSDQRGVLDLRQCETHCGEEKTMAKRFAWFSSVIYIQ